jgi:hypothetical protein
MTPNTVWREHSVVKVTDFIYDENIINPSWSTISMEYPKVPEALNLGDILVISTKMGNGVEVGEIMNIEKSIINTNTVITAKAPTDILVWKGDFIEELKTRGQELHSYWFDPAVRRLGVELSLARYAPEPDPNPLFTNVPNFHIPLDGNGDGTITEKEANDFVIVAKRLIDGAGLTFAELAEKIPRELKVRNIDLNGFDFLSKTTQFNGVAAKVQLVGGTSFVYIEQNDFTGVKIWKIYGDVDRIKLEEFAQDLIRQAREIGVPEFSDYPNALPNASSPGPWPTPRRYMSVIDKKSESIVLNDEKIASIRKVKRYGKCYYKIEMEDGGFLPSMRDGYFKECLLTIREEYPNCV